MHGTSAYLNSSRKLRVGFTAVLGEIRPEDRVVDVTAAVELERWRQGNRLLHVTLKTKHRDHEAI